MNKAFLHFCHIFAIVGWFFKVSQFGKKWRKALFDLSSEYRISCIIVPGYMYTFLFFICIIFLFLGHCSSPIYSSSVSEPGYGFVEPGEILDQDFEMVSSSSTSSLTNSPIRAFHHQNRNKPQRITVNKLKDESLMPEQIKRFKKQQICSNSDQFRSIQISADQFRSI